ncbi:unnamed protein product, partial [Didymodactylos carnosus]
MAASSSATSSSTIISTSAHDNIDEDGGDHLDAQRNIYTRWNLAEK